LKNAHSPNRSYAFARKSIRGLLRYISKGKDRNHKHGSFRDPPSLTDMSTEWVFLLGNGMGKPLARIKAGYMLFCFLNPRTKIQYFSYIFVIRIIFVFLHV